MLRCDYTNSMRRATRNCKVSGPCSRTNAVDYCADLGLGLSLRNKRGFGRRLADNSFHSYLKTQKELLQQPKTVLLHRYENIDKQQGN